MGVHVALLSAVNLGSRKVAMAPLRAACLAAGFARVETLLASGNVLLDGGRKGSAAIAKTLEALIAEEFNVTTTAILRDAAGLARALADCPYPDCPPDRLLMIFLERAASKAEGDALAAFVAGRDTYRLNGDVIHVRADRGANDIKITPAAMRRHLGQVGTGRNLNTVAKLAAKARAMEAP
jgi:uncharacterized protein (DUF1697 family)